MKRLLHLGPRASTLRPQHAGECHNCHATVTEKFCGQCGQAAHVHVASAHEFIHHFIGHYVALEGKLWATLRLLLLRPGQLTLEFIGGRRGRYIDPLRLLLTISLLVFFAMKLSIGQQTHTAPKVQDKQASSATVPAAQMPKPLHLKAAYLLAELRSDQFAGNYARYEALPKEEKARYFWSNWLKNGPTIILCLVPLVALVLQLLHLGTGWRYGEHLVFAIHLHCFTMLAFLLWVVIEAHLKSLVWLPLGWMPVYALWAMHKVYRGGALVLLVRWAALVCLEFVLFAFLVGLAFMFSFA